MTEPIWVELEKLLLKTEAPKRHAVIRTGERTPIPGHVRLAVWLRDRGLCEMCGWQPFDGPWHLDHIKPWSAGGSDDSTNLRVLCEAHNIERSNFHDDAELRPRRAVTWWCVRCHGAQHQYGWLKSSYDEGLVWCPIHEWDTARCRVLRLFARAKERGEDLGGWHERRLIEDADHLTLAYCAHCNEPSMTAYPL